MSNVRTIYLKNNITIYNLHNIKIINKSSIEYNELEVIEYSPKVIFIDVPWGDAWIKTIENYRIIFGDIELEKFVILILNNFFTINV